LTTWAWAQLTAGSYGLPGPAVVTSPWVLEVRAPQPSRRGFTRVTGPEQWGQVGTASKLVADCSEASDVLVISAEHPAEGDAAGLRNCILGAAAAGGAHWVMGGVFHEPRPQAFQDQVHQAGRLLLTGDLQAYWSGVRTGASASFAELFPDGAWAAWVPLLLHLPQRHRNPTGLSTGKQSATSDCERARLPPLHRALVRAGRAGTTIKLVEVRSVGERGVSVRRSASGTSRRCGLVVWLYRDGSRWRATGTRVVAVGPWLGLWGSGRLAAVGADHLAEGFQVRLLRGHRVEAVERFTSAQLLGCGVRVAGEQNERGVEQLLDGQTGGAGADLRRGIGGVSA